MPIDVHEMLRPSHTAVLTMEMQRGVVGDLSSLPLMAQEAQRTFPVVRSLLAEARRVGVPVVHCQAGPPAVPGAAPNYPLAYALAKRAGGRPRAPEVDDVVADIDPRPDDYYVQRHHGMSPFTGTNLDAVLRRLDVRTVVVTGVSLNVGVLGLTIEAVGLGYQAAVVTDGVAGYPPEYARSVLEYTVGIIATRLTGADIMAVWQPEAASAGAATTL